MLYLCVWEVQAIVKGALMNWKPSRKSLSASSWLFMKSFNIQGAAYKSTRNWLTTQGSYSTWSTGAFESLHIDSIFSLQIEITFLSFYISNNKHVLLYVILWSWWLLSGLHEILFAACYQRTAHCTWLSNQIRETLFTNYLDTVCEQCLQTKFRSVDRSLWSSVCPGNITEHLQELYKTSPETVMAFMSMESTLNLTLALYYLYARQREWAELAITHGPTWHRWWAELVSLNGPRWLWAEGTYYLTEA